MCYEVGNQTRQFSASAPVKVIGHMLVIGKVESSSGMDVGNKEKSKTYGIVCCLLPRVAPGEGGFQNWFVILLSGMDLVRSSFHYPTP